MNQLTDLERFYSVLERLDALPQRGMTLGSYAGTSFLPARGVYFFRELVADNRESTGASERPMSDR